MPRVSSAALCMAALIVLSACGGGGESMLGSGPMQGPVEIRDRDAAIRRAQDAAREAAASAVAAGANCDAVPAACESAQAAADAAELAQAAAEEAEISTTFDVVFRAAAAAELAATNASTASAEAARIATQLLGGGGSGDPPVSVGMLEWLLPGTVADSVAGANAVQRIERILRDRQDIPHSQHNIRGLAGTLDKPGYFDNPSSEQPSLYEHSYETLFSLVAHDEINSHVDGCNSIEYNTCVYGWGSWNHPTVSETITYVEEFARELYANGSYEGHIAMGIMDHGVFGMYYETTRHDGDLATNYNAFYGQDGAFSRTLATAPDFFEPFPVFDLNLVDLGATWSGGALGIQISSEAPVFGPATLTLTHQHTEDVYPNRPDGRDPVSGYTFALDVQWNSGDTIHFGDGRLYSDGLLNFSPLDGDDFIEGSLAGPQAQEAVGAFTTSDYVGAFGLDRE